MRKIFRPRNILIALLTPFVGLYAYWVIGENYFCSARMIRSDADAVEVAKSLFFQARTTGAKPGRVEWDQTADCCHVVRSVRWDGLIEWNVYLHGKTLTTPTGREVVLDMHLSNCGNVYQLESTLDTDE